MILLNSARRTATIALVLAIATLARAEEPLFEGEPASHWIEQLSSADVVLRQKAAWALWNLKPAKAAAPLAGALADDDTYVRDTAVKTLAKLDSAQAAIPVLTGLLKSADEARTKEYAWLIAKIDPVGAFGHEHREVRIAAIAAWLNPGPTLTAPVFAGIVVAFGDEEEEVRLLAANAIGNVYLFDRGDFLGEAKAALIATLDSAVQKDTAPSVRQWSAYALGYLGWHAEKEAAHLALPGLIVAAKDRETAVRVAAFLAFGALGEEARAATPVLLKAMGSPNAEVRLAATRILGSIAAPTNTVVEALADALEDWEPRGRANAAGSLSVFGAESAPAVPALIACMKAHTDRGTRRSCAVALAAIGEPASEATPLLVSMFESDPAAQYAFALCRLDAPNAEAALKRLVAIAGSDVGGRAMEYLGRLGDRANGAVPALAKIVDSDGPGPQIDAAVTLGRIGPAAAAAVPALEKASKSLDQDLAAAAAEALLKIRTPR